MYYRQTNRVLFNQMDSHDTMRIVNRCGQNRNRARQALALLFSMPGSVCIYYGTELLLEGGPDPDCRRCMPWKEIEKGLFADDIEFMKNLIKLRKCNKAMASDEMEFLYDEKDFLPENRLLHIVKKSVDGNVEIFMNCGNFDVELRINGNILASCEFAEGILKKDGFLIFAP